MSASEYLMSPVRAGSCTGGIFLPTMRAMMSTVSSSDVDSPQAMLNNSPAAPGAVHASKLASTAFSMKQKSREVCPSP